MSNIERGKRSVKTQELIQIAEALQVSPMALLDERSLPARLRVAPRSDGEQAIKGEAYERLLALSELHEVLSDAGLTTPNQLGAVPAASHRYWKADADALSNWATDYLKVEAAGDERFAQLADAIEGRLGVDVLVEEYAGDALSGAAITEHDFPLIFVNAQHPTPRSLFTLAHELGHLLMGHDGSITLDVDFVGADEAERQANAFGAAFLMPEVEVDRYIKDYGRGAESLLRMTYDFGVSFESLIYRLHNLRKIDAEGRDRLREIGWSGLLSMIEDSDLQHRLGPEVSMRLISRQAQRPARRPPSWLTTRCLAGHKKGVISIRPLAGLLQVEPDKLLEHIESFDDESAAALDEGDYFPHDDHSTDDELFAGSPVS
jgi:Zn-dependent peptidase ImmA (M78 family)